MLLWRTDKNYPSIVIKYPPYLFSCTVSEENPVVTIEQDAYMPEAGGSQDNTKSLTLRNRKSSGYRENNFKEKLKDDLTFSEEMTITGIENQICF